MNTYHAPIEPEERASSPARKRSRRTHIIVGIAFFALIIAMLISVFMFRQGGGDVNGTNEGSPTVDNQQTSTYGIERIDAVHQYANGTHTLTGSVTLPTPCHKLSSEVRVAESYPEQVAVQFLVEEQEGMCAQVLTAAPFTITVDASADARFRATVNGQSVTLNLVTGEVEGATRSDVMKG